MDNYQNLANAAQVHIHRNTKQLNKADAALDSLVRCLPSSMLVDAEMHRTISTMRQHLVAAVDSTKALQVVVLPKYRTSEEGFASAHKVFETPELLERILMNLDTLSLFRMNPVSRQYRDTIQGSGKLLRKMGLQPDPKSYFSFKPSMHYRALYYEANSSYSSFYMMSKKPHPTQSQLRLDVEVQPCDQLPRPGSRVRSMLLCQPPIQSINVSAGCCEHLSDEYPARRLTIEVVSNASGITLGDVFDAATRVRDAHKLCPHAHRHMHDEEGFVSSRITFEALVDAVEDDPIINKERRRAERREQQQQKEMYRRARLRPYMAEKQRVM